MLRRKHGLVIMIYECSHMVMVIYCISCSWYVEHGERAVDAYKVDSENNGVFPKYMAHRM